MPHRRALFLNQLGTTFANANDGVREASCYKPILILRALCCVLFFCYFSVTRELEMPRSMAMRALLGLALAALAPPVAARLLAEEAEDETEEEVRHYAIAIGVGLLGVTFVVGHIMEVAQSL